LIPPHPRSTLFPYTTLFRSFANNGDVTPPTKLPTFFFGVRIARIRINPKHDIDLIPGDVHPLAQRPDAVARARPVGGLQAVMELDRKSTRLNSSHVSISYAV